MMVTHLLSRIRAQIERRTPFPGTGEYWERRYRRGGTSGCGSYGHLANFKAEVLNDFVARQNIQSVVELGCGDGNQLSLARYPSYFGADISPTVVELCRSRFADDPTKTFALRPPAEQFDLSLSLDVVLHLVEDSTFSRYMNDLFDLSRHWTIIYGANWTDSEAIAAGMKPSRHVKLRRFVEWTAARRPDFALVQQIPNRYPFDPAEPKDTSSAAFHIFRRVT